MKSSFPEAGPRFWVAAVIVLALILYAGVKLIPPRWLASERPRSVEVKGTVLPLSFSGGAEKLDLNAATAEELEELPGIGPVLAARIVAFRAEHGPFRSLEDLLEVQGVGEALLARIKALVTVSRPGED